MGESNAPVWEVARAHFGDASDMVTPWVKTREGELHDGKVEAVAAAIRAMADELGVAPEGANDLDPRVILRRNAGCFVESACRQVVASRLEGPGMRRDEPGAEAILRLRTLELSGRWDRFWEQDTAAA